MTTATNAVKGTVSSVTDPLGHTVSYTYDSLRRVTKTSAMLGTQEVKTENEYDTADRSPWPRCAQQHYHQIGRVKLRLWRRAVV